MSADGAIVFETTRLIGYEFYSLTLSVLTPIILRIMNTLWSEGSLLANIFPLFGLLAFTLLWLHAISGVFEEWLRKQIDFDFFVRWSSLVIFFSIILHPLLLLILVKFNFLAIYKGAPLAIALGVVGLLLLLTYDIGKALQKHDFFIRNWRGILIVSSIGTILIFFHSLTLGSDLQSGFLRGLWIFYGTTAVLATIYTYGLKKFLD